MKREDHSEIRMTMLRVGEDAAVRAELAVVRRSKAGVVVVKLYSDALDEAGRLGLYTQLQLKLVEFSPVRYARPTIMTTIQDALVMFDSEIVARLNNLVFRPPKVAVNRCIVESYTISCQERAQPRPGVL